MTKENRVTENASLTRLNNASISSPTEINSQKNRITDINPGTVLLGKYTVDKRLDVRSGEADLYVCRDDEGNLFAAKIYRRKDAVKGDILSTLSAIPDYPFIAGICDSGEINGYPCTVIHYFKNGSLAGRKYKAEDIKKLVVPCVNAGLEFLHSHRIMHKDIKPSNLMLSDDESRIVIIDFGISSLAEDGQSIIVTETGHSPQYSAPETFSNIFLEESDYYSFGISLYELFTGATPFSSRDGLSDDEIIASASVRSIPFPEDFPEDLKNLIKGLTYKDLSHRREKNNPNRRWTGTEVNLWLKDEPQIIPGEGYSNKQEHSSDTDAGNSRVQNKFRFSKPYTFVNKSGKSADLENFPDLTDSFCANWISGKKHVGRGFLSKFFLNEENQHLANMVMDCEDEGTSDFAYFRLMLNMQSEFKKPSFWWNNNEYQDLRNLSGYLSSRIFGMKTEDLKKFESEFSDLVKALALWYENTALKENLEIINRIISIFETANSSLTARIIILSSFLDPDFPVRIADKTYSAPEEFAKEYEKIRSGGDSMCRRYISQNREALKGYGSCLNPKISSAFLMALKDMDKFDAEDENRRRQEKEEEERRLKKLTQEQEKRETSADYNAEKNRTCSQTSKKTGGAEEFLACMNSGENILFGRYFVKNQDKYDPLPWRVLTVDRDADCALLLTEYGIDAGPYNLAERSEDTWEHTHMRSWLNDIFISTAFYPDELSAVKPTKIVNHRYSLTADDIRSTLSGGIRSVVSTIFSRIGGEMNILPNSLSDINEDGSGFGTREKTKTYDRVFLLSSKEVQKYMPDKKLRRCKPTLYASLNNSQIRNGRWTSWWLRGNGKNLGNIVRIEDGQLDVNLSGFNFNSDNGFEMTGVYLNGSCVEENGDIAAGESGGPEISCIRDDLLIRPAVWVDMSAEIFSRIEKYQSDCDGGKKGSGYCEL